MMCIFRVAATVFVILSGCLIAFPPWIHTANFKEHRLVRDGGYSPLWKPPEVPDSSVSYGDHGVIYKNGKDEFEGISRKYWSTTVNIERLLLQLAGALAIASLIVLATHSFGPFRKCIEKRVKA